jgi:uncharacterized membrane protein YgdD (TMEM256/DUF423 family)
MTNPQRFALLAAGVLGGLGVALGAFGAHSLQALLAERGTAATWETASRYQLVHAVALLGAAAWLRAGGGAGTGRMLWAVRCWCAGVALFSGSLYLYAVGGPHFMVFVTPIGGVIFIAGWVMAIAAALAVKNE